MAANAPEIVIDTADHSEDQQERQQQQYLQPNDGQLPQHELPCNSAAVSTESFQASPLNESQQILHVYGLLERLGGVYGDGWHEGVELTRDGRALSCCRSAEAKRAWEERLREARYGPSSQSSLNDNENPSSKETDRYGFFLRSNTSPSTLTPDSSRTVLLTSKAYQEKRERYPEASTSQLAPKAVIKAAHTPSSRELDLENRRTLKWQRMLDPPPLESDGLAWRLKPEILQSASSRKKVGTRQDVFAGMSASD